jgi:hypothetical protein
VPAGFVPFRETAILLGFQWPRTQCTPQAAKWAGKALAACLEEFSVAAGDGDLSRSQLMRAAAVSRFNRVYVIAHCFAYGAPEDGVGVGLDVVGHGPSFRCASGDLHWTFTVEPDAHVPVMDVLGVR